MLQVVRVGNVAVSRLDMMQFAKPFLQRLVTETGETSHLAVLRHGEVISLANVESRLNLRIPATVGGRSPGHCTSIGKAILAFCPDSEIAEFIRTHGLKKYTERTIVRPADFEAELRCVRKKGYAIDNEEFEAGLKCLGAPVWNHTGRVIAAISVTGPAMRLGEDRMPVLIHSVVKAAPAEVMITADRQAPKARIDRIRTAEPGRNLKVTAKVTDPSGVKWVHLRYRHATQFEDYETAEMKLDPRTGAYPTEIPGNFIIPKWDLMYFVEVLDTKGNGRMYPDLEQEMPYVIVNLNRNT